LNSHNLLRTTDLKLIPDPRLLDLPPSAKWRFQTKKLHKNKKMNFQSDHIMRVLNNCLSENRSRKIVKTFRNAGDSLIMDQNQVMWCDVRSHGKTPDAFLENSLAIQLMVGVIIKQPFSLLISTKSGNMKQK
jgi:hypothetical protein